MNIILQDIGNQYCLSVYVGLFVSIVLHKYKEFLLLLKTQHEIFLFLVNIYVSNITYKSKYTLLLQKIILLWKNFYMNHIEIYRQADKVV